MDGNYDVVSITRIS